jgi:aarF domain-containing kinase
MPLDYLFEWIDHKPIASGSIGQVHRAALTQRGADICGVPFGKVVALKVKHPRVSQSIQRDFGIMMWAASQLEWVPALRKMQLRESLQQFAAPLREQVWVRATHFEAPICNVFTLICNNSPKNQ